MAFLFDGTNDQITHGDIATIDGATLLTLAFWYKPVTWVSGDGVAGKGSGCQILQFGADQNIFFRPNRTGLGGYAYTAASTFPNASWTHAGIVYDGSQANANRIIFYQNGSAIAQTISGTIDTAIQDAGVAVFTVGTPGSDPGFANFNLGLLKIWSVALTAVEMAQEANSYRPARTSNLILWAPYDDNAAVDYSQSGFNGTITEAVSSQGPPVSFGG